jgi:hypothetical protein
MTESTDSNLKEHVLNRGERNWLAIASWLCMLWVFIAFCILYAMLENNMIDIKGIEYSPYDLLFDCIFFSGFAAIMIGFSCGLWVLLFRKVSDYSFLFPTVVLGFLLAGYLALWTFQQYQEYENRRLGYPNSPVVVPAHTVPQNEEFD